MRAVVIGLLIAGLGAGACNRNPNVQGTGRDFAPSDNAVATAGAGEARDKSPLETAVEAKSAVREMTIPAGTELPIVLDTSVGSKTSRVEQAVRAHLSRAITIDGRSVLPEGSTVNGVVTDATPSGKVKGRAHLAVRFDSVTPRGSDERYRIETASVGRTAPATKKKDAVKIGAPAAGGAIIGGIIGGGKGAAIGAAAGGGAGTAVVLTTSGKEVSLPAGSVLRLRLTSPLTVRLRS